MRNILYANKYKARKVITEYGTFDSVKEYKRYKYLKALEEVGAITDLRRQVEFELIPEAREAGEMITKGAHKGEIKPGKLIERKCVYYADFVYTEHGETVVEDVKGLKLPEYIIKRKLMLYRYNICVKEV